MSITALIKREPVPAEIGGLTLYCEGFKASAVRAIAEESSADGAMVITNSSSRSTRLTFSGRVCTEDEPESFVLAVNDMISSGESFTVRYMGLSFYGCRLLSYSFEDKGGEAALAQVTLLSSGMAEESDEK